MISCTVLIDTGSDFDVVDLRLLNNLRHTNINSTLLKPKRNAPVAANNVRMNQLGDVILDIKLKHSTNCNQKLERKVRFTVLTNLSTPCILGIGTLRSMGLYVKGDTISLGGVQICSISDGDKTINFQESHIDENGSKWGIYADPIFNLESNHHDSETHKDKLYENDFASDIEKECFSREMKPEKYLVLLQITEDPPKALKIKSDHSRLLNELKNCKTNRKLITDECDQINCSQIYFTKNFTLDRLS